MKIVGFDWNGYSAPEQCPDVTSRQILALMTLVDELEQEVDKLSERVDALSSKNAVLEKIEKFRQSKDFK